MHLNSSILPAPVANIKPNHGGFVVNGGGNIVKCRSALLGEVYTLREAIMLAKNIGVAKVNFEMHSLILAKAVN